MSALASLVRAYDRMATRGEAAAYGYSQEKIGFVIPLNPDGSVAHAPIDLRRTEGKRMTAKLMAVEKPGAARRARMLCGIFSVISLHGDWGCGEAKR
jgi:CRISPR-associated protein (Cas_Csd1)